ncbi:hypothetical protein SUGI_0787690 [Cryptomeria japonica]|nr:hypothetical protein SUGI_0787690 [Cryptomeria japonica]
MKRNFKIIVYACSRDNNKASIPTSSIPGIPTSSIPRERNRASVSVDCKHSPSLPRISYTNICSPIANSQGYLFHETIL